MTEARRLLRGIGVCLLLLLAEGCRRRAPGPEECVRFAEMTFGHEFEVLSEFPEEKAAFDKLVNTCLTAPFSRQVFTCAEESRAPMACLQRVHPELFSNRDVDFAIKRQRRREVF
ncbi:MAG TPA: hypothetical protein VIV60_28535 [Polyangiaceae bacterium]